MSIEKIRSFDLPDTDVEKAVDFAFGLIQALPEKWKGLAVDDLRVLRSILFPENLS